MPVLEHLVTKGTPVELHDQGVPDERGLHNFELLIALAFRQAPDAGLVLAEGLGEGQGLVESKVLLILGLGENFWDWQDAERQLEVETFAVHSEGNIRP